MNIFSIGQQEARTDFTDFTDFLIDAGDSIGELKIDEVKQKRAIIRL